MNEGELSTCGECRRTFPWEHRTVCLIGTVLCPVCETAQQRYPSTLPLDVAELDFQLMTRISDSGVVCEQHDDCPCYYHTLDRAREISMGQLHDRERQRLSQIQKWAGLPIYQSTPIQSSI